MGVKVSKTFGSANEEFVEIDFDGVDARYKLRTRQSGTGTHFNIGIISGALYELILSTNSLTTVAKDNGANAGFFVKCARNSNASPAAGFLQLEDKSGDVWRVWADDTGVLRIHSADPTNANDLAGTVVGAQTSNLAFKTDIKELTKLDRMKAITEVLSASRSAIRGFRYKNKQYGGEKFPSGIITNYASRYGMDRNAEFPEGKVLNIPTALADLFIMCEYLYKENRKLERLVKKLLKEMEKE